MYIINKFDLPYSQIVLKVWEIRLEQDSFVVFYQSKINEMNIKHIYINIHLFNI